MDRERFVHLLDAYGADFRRWPASERAAATMFAAESVEAAHLIDQARGLDQMLDLTRATPDASPHLAARILATAPRQVRQVFDRRAMFALAACAVFGVVLGYGGGLLAPPPVEDEAYFTMAFEAPFDAGEEG